MLTLVVTASPATISTTMNECRLRADSQTTDANDVMRDDGILTAAAGLTYGIDVVAQN